MHRLIRATGYAIALVATLNLCGCGSGGRIAATVTLEGAPLANAQVSLMSDGNSTAGRFRGITKDDGTLELPLPGEPELPPGRYKVLIVKDEVKKGRTPPAEMKNDLTQLRAMGVTINTLPSRYADPNKTPLSAEVLPGVNTLRFALTNK